MIPDNVESIVIDDNFNENIDDITFPEKMSSIHFWNYFNQSIKKIIFPSSLKSISFGTGFNQSTDQFHKVWKPLCLAHVLITM